MSSPAPQKQGRLSEIRQGYRAVKQLDPKVGWFMSAIGLLVFAIIAGSGFALGGWWRFYLIVVAIPAALLAAAFVLNRRGNKAMYGVLEGQAGAAGAALQGMGRRGWYAAQEPVAIDAQRANRPEDLAGAAMVFRALGRPGIVLIGEGPPQRVRKLLKTEEKKVARVAPGVPIHLWTVGAGERDDEIKVSKIASKLTRMRPVLSKAEVAVVNKRLKSLGGLRPGIPAGMDPTKARVDRRAMRGK